jgi:hypothetical protein
VWAGFVARNRTPVLGARLRRVELGFLTFTPRLARHSEAAGVGLGEWWFQGSCRLGAGLEPIGQNVLQHCADVDPFGERRGFDTPSGVLFTRLESKVSKSPFDVGLGTGPVKKPTHFGDDGVEPKALDELHGVIGDAALTPNLEDRHDVGVMKSGRSAGLAAEPFLDDPVARRLTWQHFQRHATAQGNLFGLVHDTHAAVADLTEDPVIADLPL